MIAWALLSVAALSSPDSVRDQAFTASDHCGGLESPERAAQVTPMRAKPGNNLDLGFTQPFVQRNVPVGADHVKGILSGKTVYLSAGHGLYYVPDLNGWRAQRGNNYGVVEDLVSIEAVNELLIPYLHAMGAYVVPLREADMQPEMVIVDDADAIIEGDPAMGPNAPFGWGEVPLPITSDAVAPFQSGSSRTFTSTAEPSGGLSFVPTFAKSGYYNVYISFTQNADRVPDAHYVVHHSGGESHFRIDQRRHGSTWVLLGKFYFEAGAPTSEASVTLHSDSSTPGAVISADAVRFGGGQNLFDRGGGVAGRPMYEHCARYYTQWNGAPPSAFAFADLTDHDHDIAARSRFVAWEHNAGEDAIYVSWHTNATAEGVAPGTGLESYTFGSGDFGPQSGFDGVPGSIELQNAVHGEVVADIHAAWDPEWRDRGRFVAHLGEVNSGHNPVTPSLLIEIGFHNNPLDAESLVDPAFRRIATRAMAQGIARYFAEKDGIPLVLPPEPPQAVSVRNNGSGGLEVQWTEPKIGPGGGDPATGYIVQVSRNGYGFDDGTYVEGTNYTIEGLSEGEVRYVRVLSANAGGHSLPSHRVAAAVAPSGQGSVLIVGGFDRLDRDMLVLDDMSAFDLDTVGRMWLDRINDGSYAVRHAQAVLAAGISFDGATDDAVELGQVELAPYQAVDWFTGEDSVGSDPLSPVARDAITDYLNAGGRLLLSGAELGYTLDGSGTPEDKAFFNERLHARFVLDSAETYEAAALPGPLDGIADVVFSDPTVYDPESPDVFEPTEGGNLVLAYQNGAGMGAGIAWGDGKDADRGVLLGFPFETIADAQVRADLMTRVLTFLEVEEDGGPIGGTSGGDDGDSGDGGGGGTGKNDESGTDGGPWTAGGARAEGEAAGCGCTSSGGGPLGGLLFVLVGAFSRRRRSRQA